MGGVQISWVSATAKVWGEAQIIWVGADKLGLGTAKVWGEAQII
jgi:hypothetical protein